MKLNCLTLALLLLFCVAKKVNSYKILTYCVRFGQSHVFFIGGISDQLAEAGHNVTYLQTELVAQTTNPGASVANVLLRKADFKLDDALLNQDRVWKGDFSLSETINQYSQFGASLAKSCYHLLKDEELMNRLAREEFDIGIGEHYDVCTYALFHRIGIKKFISAYAIPMFPIAFIQLGLPLTTSYLPLFSNPTTPEMTYGQRFKNFLSAPVFNLISYQCFGKPLKTAINKALGYELTPANFSPKSSYFFVNTDEHLDYVQPITHKIVHIGGLRLKDPKPLSPEFEGIAKQSVRGIVIISFGTVALSCHMTNQTKTEIVEFISNFPDITFIWKYEKNDGAIPPLSNLYLKKWIPQSDLLGHPKTLAFITHAGMNSLSESAYRGVPLIAIPLFADQKRNALMAEYRKIGRVIEKSKLTENTLTYELNKILSPDHPYRANAKHMAQMIQAKPFKPAQRVVQLVEHAIKFNVSENFDLYARHLSTIQFYGIDVYAPLALGLTLILTMLFFMLKQLVRVTCWIILGGSTKTVKKENKLD
ncbi:UDP-glucuronosyltransferase [Aphelenchoides bicaudatus]|nr:UDP-glucuronosyltransferase [Aphelenchoides bicaudatus]